MKIKITPFSPKQKNAKGSFKIGNNYYLAEYHSAGMVTEIRKNDDFLKSETGWVTRSEIPFITAIRHSQLKEQYLVSRVSPIIRKHAPFFVVEEVAVFPSKEKCKQLVYKYCDLVTDEVYDFSSEKINRKEVKILLNKFDYNDDLIIRAGSCLYKAYLLLDTSSSTFAEEIYMNTYIALESIINHLEIINKHNRKQILGFLEKKLSTLGVCQSFIEYEGEMRDSIRNNIVHPYRKRIKKSNANIWLMADYIFEDLPLVDLIFFNLLKGELYIKQ